MSTTDYYRWQAVTQFPRCHSCKAEITDFPKYFHDMRVCTTCYNEYTRQRSKGEHK